MGPILLQQNIYFALEIILYFTHINFFAYYFGVDNFIFSQIEFGQIKGVVCDFTPTQTRVSCYE